MVQSLSPETQLSTPKKETSLETNGNHLNIKYLKLVNHTASGRKDWSYKEYCKIDASFYLHWAMNEDKKKGLSEEEINKILARKKKDANKPDERDRILLCQNHYNHGHRVTHVVETVSSTAEKGDEMWTRLVRVVWVVAQDPWEKYAPEQENVIGNFSFKGGNLISANASSIVLNLDALK
ncbi:hypothetical protein ANSO36C_56980 [Nostoc cf. commune SO-36]|uniref:Uncharacterized protein n=1 Tax=Nostoc cf. commune SO-36 TaxID=449208 RepID=A0ABN6Q9N5_NOSCO|nr:hypothetical protein [Nostoc commune]BDI19896.1 hypothetical protein ANSO36C_56980 [Nostoc cf. commune SO-36]